LRARAIDIRALVIYLCAAWMTVLLVQEFRSVAELADVPLSRQAIVMARNAEPLMPRGATVTVIEPAAAPDYDFTHYLTASGMLPRHRVLHPTLADGEHWPDFVIALGEPLQHRGYVLVREFREGRLYAVRR
jgi:hypothetical protein